MKKLFDRLAVGLCPNAPSDQEANRFAGWFMVVFIGFGALYAGIATGVIR